jgi:protein-S-isoprenylcysteine O-methyltransferase Ste14
MMMQRILMKATRFEYRLRFLVHGLIFFLGFATPWDRWLHLDSSRTSWTWLATRISEAGMLHIEPAFRALLVLCICFMGLGAWFRLWGSAYITASVMKSRSMHGEAMLADGPFRRTRNPLYLGTLLHTLGLALLMPPSGAVVAVVLIWVLQVRLALAEEPFLTAQFGQPYLDYVKAVPRFLPSLKPLVPAAGVAPRWVQAFFGEFYFIGAFCVVAVTGWGYNGTLMERGILISLGAWFVILALMPKAKVEGQA